MENIPKFGEAQKIRKAELTKREKLNKTLKNVLRISTYAGGCAVVAVAFVVGMQVDHLQSPVLINTQTPVIWRNAPTATPPSTPTPAPQVTPRPAKKASVVAPVRRAGGVRLTEEQSANVERITKAFPHNAQIMVAIAMAESVLSCGTVNHQDSNGVQSVGLFQINDGRTFSEEDITNLTTCSHNIERAQQKYIEQGLTAWGSYADGRYYQFLNIL